MARRLDKSLGRSFTEIGEILGIKPDAAEWAYVTGMRKLRDADPENGRLLLEQLKAECRTFARNRRRQDGRQMGFEMTTRAEQFYEMEPR